MAKRINKDVKESRALKEHRHDKSWVILTAEKGVAMVVFDKQDYINKVKNLLEQWGTYRTLTTYHTHKKRTN